MLRGRMAALAAGLAIAAAAAITAGCGSGARALALDPVSAAATKTQQAGAARVRFRLALANAQSPQAHTVTVRGTGAIDGTSAELTLALAPLLHAADLPAGTNGSVKEIFVHQNGDYVLYVKTGLAASYLPTDKQWVELDVSKLGTSAGVDLGKLLSGSELQPNDALAMLEAAGAKVTKVGPATLDGAATTHYRVTVDVAKALQAKGLTSPLLAGAAAKVPTIPANVWIGDDGLVHRISLSYAVAQRRVAMRIDFTDYGASVTVAPPPSDAVFDATPFVQSGLGTH
jgi:hypothetical protein